jgi:HlyD family secretion protein
MSIALLRRKSFCTILIIALSLNACVWQRHPHFSGYVEGEPVYIASPFEGVLQMLTVQRGQSVKKGVLLFRLDPNPQLMQLTESKAKLDEAKAILLDLQSPRRPAEIEAIKAQIAQTEAAIQLAQVRVSRFKDLYKSHAFDKDSLDVEESHLQQQKDLKRQYESNLALAESGARFDQIKAQESEVQARSAQLANAQWQFNQKTMIAPGDGVIFDTYYHVGELVHASQPVLSILRPENVYIQFFVPAQRLPQLKLRQEIHFECAGCGPNNVALIQYISPVAEFLPPLVYSRENDANIVFRVKAAIKQGGLFKPGQPVTVIL